MNRQARITVMWLLAVVAWLGAFGACAVVTHTWAPILAALITPVGAAVMLRVAFLAMEWIDRGAP